MAQEFELSPPQGVTTEELLADLCQLRDEFGTKLTMTLVTEHGEHSTSTCYSRFASWGDALDRAFDNADADESA